MYASEKQAQLTTTIYDVAKEAGVSTATVSKVLSGQPYVSAKTRARVMATVERLQFVPNVAARGLAGARTYIIGVVVSYEPEYLFADPHLLRILQGATEVATAHDCALLLSPARSQEDRLSAYQRLLGQQYVDGALIDGSLGSEGLSLLRGRGYPVVAIGHSHQASCVHSDDRGGARIITEHLIGLGHRRIGLISGPISDQLVTQARYAGHREAMEAASLPFDEERLVYGTFRSTSGFEGAEKLMAATEAPTALFAFNDRMAFGAIRWLRAQGLRVPEDVSVVGFDDIPNAATFDPPLTTIRQLSLEQGRQAATLLFEQIQGNAPNERQEVALPTELVLRHSTAPPKGG